MPFEKDSGNIPFAFRKDLSIFPGPTEEDGMPTYNVYDPVKGQYFKIDWKAGMVIKLFKPGMSYDELVEQVNNNSTLHVTKEDVMQFFELAKRMDLLKIPKSSELLDKYVEITKPHWLWLAMMNYLYFRIPLWNPDTFLTKSLDYVKPLFSKTAIFVYVVLSALGLFTVFTHFNEYIHTFNYFFNLEGIAIYVFAVFMVKICHEMGHAYTAKYYKIPVPTMGIALMVLWPVLFTNVTHAWRLKSRKQRFAISAAGIVVETVLAGLATLGWALTDPGPLHSVFFVVSSSSWIHSLLINANPAMRFDGYYLMSDMLGIDNLQQRSFAIARWMLREKFLKLNAPCPEDDLSPKMQKIMLAYSIYTWLYRIILYTAVALFVYFQFTKVLGIILFIVEVLFFILAPFGSEIRQLYRQRAYFNWNIRAKITSCIVGLFAFWFVVPLPHKEYFAAVTAPMQEQIVYVPYSSEISKLGVTRESRVHKGDLIVSLQSETLKKNLEALTANIDMLQREIYNLELKEESESDVNLRRAELEKQEAELKAAKSQYKQLQIVAEEDGTVYAWDEKLRVGLSLPAGYILGKIADVSKMRVISFATEKEISDFEVGKEITFKLLNPIMKFQGKIASIQPINTATLQYPSLASVYHGALAVLPKMAGTERQTELKLLQTYYQIEIHLDATESYTFRYGQSGTVEVRGPWRSKMWVLVEKAMRVFWQESGF